MRYSGPFCPDLPGRTDFLRRWSHYVAVIRRENSDNELEPLGGALHRRVALVIKQFCLFLHYQDTTYRGSLHQCCCAECVTGERESR